MRTIVRRAGAVILALAAASCTPRADADAGPSPAGVPIQVEVQNDGTIPTHVRVYAIGGGGAPVQLGTLGTLGTGTLEGTLPSAWGWQLRAEGGTGYVLNSPRVTVRANDRLVWDMRRNRLTVQR
jgi:hypothetical protein